MAVLKPERLQGPAEREAIAALTSGYSHPAGYYVELLAQGMARQADAFFPRPVISPLPELYIIEKGKLRRAKRFDHTENKPYE